MLYLDYYFKKINFLNGSLIRIIARYQKHFALYKEASLTDRSSVLKMKCREK